MWLLVYLAYITFTYFAVLNVVTGVFCQSAIESAAHDQEAMLQAFISNKRLYISRFMELFAQIDDDNSGYITKEQFLSQIEDDRVQGFFSTLDIDPSDAINLFRLI